MILDLKGKLENIVPEYFPNLFNEGVQPLHSGGYSLELEEALLALKALGYSDKETQKAAKELSKESLSTEEYIKRALKSLLR